MKKRGESRLLVAFDDGDLLVEETLLVGHRLEHTVEDIIEELLFGGDYDIDFGMKLVVLSSDYLCLEVGDDFWRPYFAAEQENPAVLRVSTTDVLERVVDRALATEFRRLDEIGAKLMLTNHDTDLIRELYEGFDLIEVDVRRSINRNGDGRTGVEVIITNGYENRIGR